MVSRLRYIGAVQQRASRTPVRADGNRGSVGAHRIHMLSSVFDCLAFKGEGTGDGDENSLGTVNRFGNDFCNPRGILCQSNLVLISSYSRHRNIIPSAAPGSSAGSPGPQSPRVPEDCNRKCPVCKIQSFLAADHGRLRCTDLAILLCKISQCSWRVVQFPSSSTFRPHLTITWCLMD